MPFCGSLFMSMNHPVKHFWWIQDETSASVEKRFMDFTRKLGALWKMSLAMPSLVVNDNQAAKMQRKHGICLCPFVWMFIYEHDHPVVPFLWNENET